jgi:hypothetical protein
VAKTYVIKKPKFYYKRTAALNSGQMFVPLQGIGIHQKNIAHSITDYFQYAFGTPGGTS